MYANSFLYSLGIHSCMLCVHLSGDELKNTWWTMDTATLWSTHTAIDWSTALQ